MCRILKSNIVNLLISICFIGFIGCSRKLAAQSEVMAWGNLAGIRIDGQLMEFETSLLVVEKGWENFNKTDKEKQRPIYNRVGLQQIVTTKIEGISFKETINESDNGTVNVNIETSSETDTLLEGVFFCIELPEKYYSTASLQFTKPSPSSNLKLSASDINTGSKLNAFQVNATGFKIESPNRQLEVNFKTKSGITVSKDIQSKNIQIFIELLDGKIKKGQKSQNSFVFKATGDIDKTSAEMVLDIKNVGRQFDGLGGNFRLQNPITDPQVIDYCLDNLRVAWGRVEMPWNFWHPNENIDPTKTALAGNINPRVDAAMKMAKRLVAAGIPVIVSDWSAPNWAILGDPRDAFRNRSKGIYGYQLNPEKMDKIFQSIGDYLVYLKIHYGVEASMFSFNESDLGINVRHTGEEHVTFIKGLGKHLALRGLATKLLLGDNSDATTFDFIVPAMEDPETHKYIGAISFHSWRGCDDETLKKMGRCCEKNEPPVNNW